MFHNTTTVYPGSTHSMQHLACIDFNGLQQLTQQSRAQPLLLNVALCHHTFLTLLTSSFPESFTSALSRVSIAMEEHCWAVIQSGFKTASAAIIALKPEYGAFWLLTEPKSSVHWHQSQTWMWKCFHAKINKYQTQYCAEKTWGYFHQEM